MNNLDFSQLFGDPIDLATPTLAKPPGARVEHRDFQNVPIFTAISGDELVRVRCGIWALESGYWRYAARVASHLLAHLSLFFLFQYYWRNTKTNGNFFACNELEGRNPPKNKLKGAKNVNLSICQMPTKNGSLKCNPTTASDPESMPPITWIFLVFGVLWKYIWSHILT